MSEATERYISALEEVIKAYERDIEVLLKDAK